MASPSAVYERRRPEETTLYQVVADNLDTLYAAVDDGALPITLPAFVRKELEGYLDRGLLCRGFARVRCDGCDETRLVAFSCKGRGFCPSCLGRRMAATAAHLVEEVLPVGVPLRQWVLSFPFAWRKRLGYDGPLLSTLTRIFITTVLGFYRAAGAGSPAPGQSGAVVAVQRTSSDLKLNPHLHAVFLEGAYRRDGASGEPWFDALAHLSTSDVAAVLERARDRMTRHLRKKGMLREDGAGVEEDETTLSTAGLASLAASAVSGASPPTGPEWRRRALPLAHRPMVFERPLCVAVDGFTLHAATRAGGLDAELSLLSRLVAAVPAPRFHTVRYAGVLGSASKLRARIVPARAPTASAPAECPSHDDQSPRRSRYRPWAELLKRTFGFDVLTCPACGARMRILAMVTEPKSIARYLRALGEPTDAPARSPPRGPPHWKSRVLRRNAAADEAAAE